MSLKAFALLRSGEENPDTIELFALEASFADEPERLAEELLRTRAERVHDDPRGVFVLPEAALSAARGAGTYDAALEAVGEAGMWVELEGASSARATNVDALLGAMAGGEALDPHAVQASLAELMGGLGRGPSDELEGEATSPGAPLAMPLDVASLLSDPAMQALAAKMSALVPEGGLGEELALGEGEGGIAALLGSPAFAAMLEGASELLAKNPEQARELAARLGFDPDDPDDA